MARGLINHFELLRSYARKIGWPAALALRFSDLKTRAGFSSQRNVELWPALAKYPLAMRVKTSDRQVLGQVFIEEEYGPVALSNPKMILDLGANVGYASAYFLSKYPGARVLALEPDPGNFKICERNLAPYGDRAKVLLGAVWPERSKLVLDYGSFRDGGEWSTQVREPSAGDDLAQRREVEAYDVPTLLEMPGTAEVDLAKIDIERSEVQLFSRNTSAWLPFVRNLCIELHDDECQRVFFEALKDYSYELSYSGDLTICSNLVMKT
jgi:FkbM family methyltransferase